MTAHKVGNHRHHEDSRDTLKYGPKMRDVCAKSIAMLEQSDTPLRAIRLREAAGLKVSGRSPIDPFLDALTWWDARIYESSRGYVGLNDRHEQEAV